MDRVKQMLTEIEAQMAFVSEGEIGFTEALRRLGEAYRAFPPGKAPPPSAIKETIIFSDNRRIREADRLLLWSLCVPFPAYSWTRKEGGREQLMLASTEDDHKLVRRAFELGRELLSQADPNDALEVMRKLWKNMRDHAPELGTMPKQIVLAWYVLGSYANPRPAKKS